MAIQPVTHPPSSIFFFTFSPHFSLQCNMHHHAPVLILFNPLEWLPAFYKHGPLVWWIILGWMDQCKQFLVWGGNWAKKNHCFIYNAVGFFERHLSAFSYFYFLTVLPESLRKSSQILENPKRPITKQLWKPKRPISKLFQEAKMSASKRKGISSKPVLNMFKTKFTKNLK